MTRLLVGRVSALTSKTMAAIKRTNTSPERALRKHLSALGLKYRLHKKGLPGRPDIVFVKQKVAVFCDGDFWHGRKWRGKKLELNFRVRNEYWTKKIEGNMARDKRNNRDLRKLGWVVLRYWETDIKKNGPTIAKKIAAVICKRT